MRIERHEVGETRLNEMKDDLDRNFRSLADFLEAAKRDPMNLSLLVTNACSVAAREVLFDPRSPRARKALGLAARASAALFATAAATQASPVTVTLDVGDAPVTYTSGPDESTAHVGRWISGFYLGKIVRDREAVDLICQTDPQSLRGSSTRGPEYLYLYARALRDFHTLRWADIVDTMLAAVDATDPERTDIVDEDWALWLHVPEIEALIYAVTKDAKFGDALRRAVQHHKEFWSKTKDDRMSDPDGFFSAPLTGLARIGLDQELSFDVESPYVPRELLE